MSDESTEHVSEVLVAAGNHQVVGEVAIGALPETFSNVARYFPARFGKLFVKIEIPDEFRTPQEWRNCVNSFEGFYINQQIL